MTNFFFQLPLNRDNLAQRGQRIYPGVRGRAKRNIKEGDKTVVVKGSKIIIQPLDC